jgi:hypothetical protein
MNHQLFISIRENFIKLLKDGNNSYKYVRQYREKINNYIKEDDKSDATILKQLLYMLITIYSEKEKCRFHTNDDIAAKIEKVIIIDSLKILKEDKYKEQNIVEINEMYFSIYKNKCGLSANINLNKITEITEENITDIHTNFNNVIKLLEPSKHLNDNLKQIDDYLFCLYYFSCI